MRGEYGAPRFELSGNLELPPRARRILVCGDVSPVEEGTTSACAENTGRFRGLRSRPRNYLRVRGEYTPTNPGAGKSLELPPRARRIRGGNGWGVGLHGTTSACAENTSAASLIPSKPRNYLRVRGEYISNLIRQLIQLELPPRARRIREYESVHIGP